MQIERRRLPQRRAAAAPPPRAASVDLAGAIEALSGRVRRLTIRRRDPDAFFEERSEIAGELAALARQARCAKG